MFIARILFLFVFIVAAAPTIAQTCAAPIQITGAGAASGSTCSGTMQLPSLVNGAIDAGGIQQMVYELSFASGLYPYVSLTLTPNADVDMALFVCPNACSPTASCIAAVDNNGAGVAETAGISNPVGDYYVIVQATADSLATCGGYTLSLALPL